MKTKHSVFHLHMDVPQRDKTETKPYHRSNIWEIKVILLLLFPSSLLHIMY